MSEEERKEARSVERPRTINQIYVLLLFAVSTL